MMKFPPIKVKTVTTVDRTLRIELTRDDILRLLRADGYKIPNDADVEFRVPGGGDWSNMDVGIDEENPVSIRWKEKTVEVGAV